jgi:hypothetical protein
LFAAARREQALTSRGIAALVEREIGTDFVEGLIHALGRGGVAVEPSS